MIDARTLADIRTYVEIHLVLVLLEQPPVPALTGKTIEAHNHTRRDRENTAPAGTSCPAFLCP